MTLVFPDLSLNIGKCLRLLGPLLTFEQIIYLMSLTHKIIAVKTCIPSKHQYQINPFCPVNNLHRTAEVPFEPHET